jgi:hypothetical protein
LEKHMKPYVTGRKELRLPTLRRGGERKEDAAA